MALMAMLRFLLVYSLAVLCWNDRPMLLWVTSFQPALTRRSSSSSSPSVVLCAEADIRAVAVSNVEPDELAALKQAVVLTCQDQMVSVQLEGLKELHTTRPSSSRKRSTSISTSSVPGATQRVLLLEASSNTRWTEEELLDLQIGISQEFDEYLYQNIQQQQEEVQRPQQPVFITIQSPTKKTQDLPAYLNSLVEQEVQKYEMRIPLPQRSVSDNDNSNNKWIPSQHIEVDGAFVRDTSTNEVFWDTSSILVVDDLVDDTLRQQLLDVVNGKDEDGDDDDETRQSEPWNDIEDGPDPRRWVKGGLMDIPDNNDDDSNNNDPLSSSQNEGDTAAIPTESYGLTDEAIEEICFTHHDAFQEFEQRLSAFFEPFLVTRLPEAVLGDCVSPLAANAPVFGQTFQYHIDADPNLTPPSPWTDIFGRYPNRQPGKPRFVSCLIYLNAEWKTPTWGACTQFLDVASGEVVKIDPKPGRCVFMDQDITHTVTAPWEAAGKNRPRYSLVWKLILHPKEAHQDMSLVPPNARGWPEPMLVGSARRQHDTVESVEQ